MIDQGGLFQEKLIEESGEMISIRQVLEVQKVSQYYMSTYL